MMQQRGAGGLIRHRFVRLPLLVVASLLLVLSPVAILGQPEDYYGAGGGGEDYQDYTDPYGQQDNLYADYAAHQQDKLSSGGGG